MEQKASLIDPLLERAKAYGTVTYELVKLKTVDKAADLTSLLVSRLLFLMAAGMSLIALNVGISFWLGGVLGQTYYGFLVVALFYGLVGIILLLLHPRIKSKVYNALVKNLLN
jgi:hypothetical protein